MEETAPQPEPYVRNRGVFQKRYSVEPAEPGQYIQRFDEAYTRFARVYDAAVKGLPVWKTWLRHALPHIRGPRVLELSFGTGYLLTQYATEYQCVGLDYNERMIGTARRNLLRNGIQTPLVRGDAHHLPFAGGAFNCVVITMAFTGYPDALRALAEVHRVLETRGRLVMVDIAYPEKNRRPGIALANLWKLSGDLIRDLSPLLDRAGFEYSDEEIGGFGSVHLFRATKLQ